MKLILSSLFPATIRCAFLLVLITKPGHILSQKITSEQYVQVFSKVDSLFQAYLDYSTLRKPGEDNVSDGAIAKFKGLFESNSSKIDDDLVLSYFDANYVDHHQYKERTLNDYCSKVQSVFREGLSIDVKSAKPYYGELESMQTVRVLIDKQIKAKTTKGLWVEVRDTVELQFVFNEQYQNPKIKSVKLRTSSKNEIPGYRHLNDDDRDFIPNEVDPCRKQPGFEDQTNNPGCPTLNEKGLTEEPDLLLDVYAIGGVLKTNLSLTSSPFAAYNLAGNHSDSNKAINPTMNLNVLGFGATISYYFGTAAHFGIGVGFQYVRYSGTIKAPDFNVTYKEVDAAGNNYRRIIRSTSEISEDLSLSQLALPILLKWKGNIGQSRFKYEFAAGMIYGLNVNGNSNFENNTFTYEGIHTLENNNWGYSVANTSGQILYTEGSVQSPNSLETAAIRGNNDFGINKRPKAELSENSIEYNSGLKMAAAPSLYFKTSKSLLVSLGLLVSIDTWTNADTSSSYYLTKAMGEYNTMAGGIEKSDNLMYSLTFGIRYAFGQER